VIVVSDSSPLIALAEIGSLHLLSAVYPKIHLPTEVYNEVVIAGAGLPASSEVAHAQWLEVTPLRDEEALQTEMRKTGLGPGEVGAVLLAKELGAPLVLIDERKARRYAQSLGLITVGCIGILEMLHRKGLIADLRTAYEQLLAVDFRIDLGTLNASLLKFGLKPL
jgi:predicted nucleic acid-binding protein